SPRPPTPTAASGDGDCSLVLSHIRADDAGEYGLRLEANGTRPTRDLRWFHRVVLNVTATPPAPHLWPKPEPLTHGRSTTLGCWVPPTCPEDTVTLAWDGPATKAPWAKVEAWTPPDLTTSPPGAGISLEFNPPWYLDKSNLSCILRGADGKTLAQASQQLQVHYAPRDVWVEVEPASPVHEGWQVTLSCHDSANPPSYTYTWSLEGRILAHSTAKFILQPVRSQDSGSYRCQATNIVGMVESSPTVLEVHYAPQDVRVEVESPVYEGWEVTLSCRNSANPPSKTYAWSLEGRILSHSGAQLHLSPVQEVDGGSYRCQATNGMGTADSPPTLLEVYYRPRVATLVLLTPVPVLVGTNVILRCELGLAHPVVSVIKWLRNDRQEASTFSPTLSFIADPSRTGTYRCVGQNIAGSTQSPPLAIIVWFGPRSVELLPEPGEGVSEMTTVALRCRADARPPPDTFEWFHDGQALGRDPRGLWVLREVGTQASGRYRCRATNAIASADSPDVTITVYCKGWGCPWGAFGTPP
ncbi:CD22 protein, partial [Anseranas semipalmata]|nr:CD22 protein [Anseranas semipalmata]